MARVSPDRVTVAPTGAALGAEVSGVDLRAIDNDDFAAIYRAWLDHQVLLVRNQQLSDGDLIAFSRRFGVLDLAPVQENGRRSVEGHPEIYIVSNVVENGVAIGSLGSGEAVWHTDMSYLADPPRASALFALEVPDTGGDTIFCTMYGAWEALPAPLQQRIEGLQVKHDGTYNSGGYVRAGVTPTTIRGPRRAHCIRSCASIPKPAAAASISAAGGTPTSTACRSKSPTRSSTRCGRARPTIG